MRRPLALALAALGLTVAACGGDDEQRPLPDVDPPVAAELPPSEDGVVDDEWLDETSEATQIPRRVLQGYVGAAVRLATELEGCTLPWNTLAGIGRVESIHGEINGSSIDDGGVARPDIVGIPLDGSAGVQAIEDTDDGRLDGDTEWDRAVGPMQFIPQTWERWGADGGGDGGRNPQNIDDAALAAGRYLCDAGGELDTRRGWLTAVLTYNNSAAYAAEVAGHANEHAEAAQ
ncbi:lytic murein transglycosylase [Aeromicrobium sp. CF4.19]|uniref:lytic murein transglycosylase n=1 Tax=Aeromicrobium sp. CF4.19 TaxID=3373082 RepID=UPI003EE76C98